MSTVDWRIPPSVRRWFAGTPTDAPVTALLRHSVRGPLPAGDQANAVPLTRVGVQLARNLGALLGDRVVKLHTSPLPRCVQSAEAVRCGAGADIPIVHDRLLGDPGVYVVDGRVARSNWETLGHDRVMQSLMTGCEPLPGMADPDPAARFFVRHMLANSGDRPGLYLFVTHDSIITATVARILGEPLEKSSWPWYLEGAFFWRQGDRVVIAYRDNCRQCETGVFASLDERSVIDFARRQVSRIFGAACKARFFLAGGAFKTLLTGSRARDLDLWAPSVRDRELLKIALEDGGAVRLDDHPFAETFAVDGQTVELPYKTDPNTLEGRLARFDIALSAVGAEHEPGGRWRAAIHPLARTSIAHEQVLLLKPLVNWKWALATLERLRRYASELQYSVPPAEEEAVWRVFDAQSDHMKKRMLENYERVAEGGYGVREEALCRLFR